MYQYRSLYVTCFFDHHLNYRRMPETPWKPHKSKDLKILHRIYAPIFFSTPKKKFFFSTSKNREKNFGFFKVKNDEKQLPTKNRLFVTKHRKKMSFLGFGSTGSTSFSCRMHLDFQKLIFWNRNMLGLAYFKQFLQLIMQSFSNTRSSLSRQ